MIGFIAGNWLWIVVILALVAMHRGGGCGGMHGAHHRDNNDKAGRNTDVSPAAPPVRASTKGTAQ